MEAIILNDNWKIIRGSYSWELIFSEIRERQNKKTGKIEEYTFEDKWYYPEIKMLLKRLINEELKDSSSIIELSEKMDKITLFIDSLKNTIFKP
tara:strand:- start:8383 stop:8664 length:282 start_codon:yes stop_codon:yes gene_type:complete